MNYEELRKREEDLTLRAIGMGLYTRHGIDVPVYILGKRAAGEGLPGCVAAVDQYLLACTNDRIRWEGESWTPVAWVINVRWAITRQDVLHPEGSKFGTGDLVRYKEGHIMRSTGLYRIERDSTDPGGVRASRPYNSGWDPEENSNCVWHLNSYIIVNVLTGHSGCWHGLDELELVEEETAS